MIRDSIIKCLNEVLDEDELVAELNSIIDDEGNRACQVIFHVLTHLDLQPEEAMDTWHRIITHREGMSSKMERSVNLRTAICDYFCSVNHSLKNPKVVEIHVFEKTFKTSRYDSLTGLFNRLSFDEELSREISRARRYDTDLSLLFFDLDDFKKVNDIYGHPVGDMVLKKVANTIMSGKRTEDIAARYGGEELVLILPKTGKNNALIVGERIRGEVENMRLEHEGEKITLTISGGLASYPVNATDASELIKCADNALYRAKGSGKNNIALYSIDRRRFLRIDFVQNIEIRKLGFNDTGIIDVMAKNISVGGLLFEHNVKFDLGTRIQLNVPIDEEKPLLIVGTVIRVETISNKMYDIGISISLLDMDKNIKKRIVRWLNFKKKVSEIER